MYADTRPGAFLATDKDKEKTMIKQETIAQTMRTFMSAGPSVQEFPTYKALNDHVGAIHGKAEGVCQALAGPKAWEWTADPTTKTWRKATPEEVEAKRTAAAGKNHGGPRSKVLSDTDREALQAQIDALVVADNRALAPLLAGLLARRDADDLARKGSMKDRLAAAIDKLGIERAVAILEAQVAETDVAEDAAESPDAIVDRVLAKAFA